ncbi:hypothetical protein FH972_023913 [Carpinus fangiana]|uniref:aspartate--tRNA ligase n=1 Tax=Carpinus fangiana TaxID=176857 RepID=A0A5N6KZ19_9ROSI|nr:hypothetical protein FH972_023913 [Carpinus fangiana]
MSDAPKEQTLPERPAGEGAAEGEKGPSKNALKKAAKEKEKAEKAAKRKAEEAAQKQAAEANDISKDSYGDLPLIGSKEYTPPNDNRTTLRDIAAKYAGSTSLATEGSSPEVRFRAVVENAREQSAKLTFLVLGHKLDTIQAVVAASDTLSRQMVKFAKNITSQSQVLVHGRVTQPKDEVKSTTIGTLEIQVTKLFVIARAETPLPIQVEDCERPLPEDGTSDAQAQKPEEEAGRPIVALNTRLNNRTIDLRAKLNLSIFTIKDGVVALFSEFLRERGFLGIQTPKMLGAASESGASVFEIKYFNTKAYLAQSPQLHKQMLIAAQFERVFEVGPVFRAENSNTARHLTEFTGLDLEMAFEEHYHEVVALLEELMLYIFNGLRTRYARETELVRRTYRVEEFKLPEAGKVPRIPFSEGVKMLREAGVEIGDYDDISTAQEKHLGRLVLQKYGTDFYVLDKYPLAVRPFYTMPSPETSANPPAEQLSNSYDFHMRGQEILSGAQRVHDAKLLQERMRGMDPPVNPDQPGLKEYVDSFKAGCPPHAGAGLGLERIVMLWLGLPNIRLATAFTRDPSRLSP